MSTYATKNGYILNDVDGLKFDGIDRIVSAVKLRELFLKDAALTPPETAEAVPVAVGEPDGFINRAFRDALLEQKGKGYWHHQMVCGKRFDNSFPIYLSHPDPVAARLREDLERIITDTESKDAADLEDMANVGHAIMAALKRLGRSYSNSPEEVLFDLENELFDAKREMDAVIAAMDRTGIPRERDDVWFGLCRRIEMLSTERDDAVKALETAREAMLAIRNVADRNLKSSDEPHAVVLDGERHTGPLADAWVNFLRLTIETLDAARSASSQGGE